MDRADEGVVEGAADLGAIGAAVDLAEGFERDDALGHRTMTAADAESLDDRADDFARSADIADVANGEDEVCGRPFPTAIAHSAPSACNAMSATWGITSSRTRPRTRIWMPSRTSALVSARPSAWSPGSGRAGLSMRRSNAGLWLGVQIGEGEHVARARLPAEVLGVALDAVEERGRQLRADLGVGCTQVFGEDRRGRAVARADVRDGHLVARSLGVVVDDDVDVAQAFGKIVSEDVGLHVHEHEPVELRQLVGCDHADLDPDRVAEGLVLGALYVAEGDQGRRRALATEQRTQGVGAGDAVGIWIRLDEDAHLLAGGQQLADLHDPLEVGEVVELLVDVVADQGLPAGSTQRGMIGNIVFRQAVREYEDRRVLVDLPDLAHREPRPRTIVADESVFVVVVGIEARDRFFVETPLQDLEARRSRAGLFLTRDPGQLLELVRADAAPEARTLGPVANDDSTSHPTPGGDHECSKTSIRVEARARLPDLRSAEVTPWSPASERFGGEGLGFRARGESGILGRLVRGPLPICRRAGRMGRLPGRLVPGGTSGSEPARRMGA